MLSRRTVHRLSMSDWRIVAEAAVMIPATAAGLRILGLQGWRDFLARTSERRLRQAGLIEKEARLLARLFARLVRRFPYRPSCLHQSLVLWWLLRRRGISSTVEFGVRNGSEGFAAHAWVTCNDIVLNDQDDVGQRFARFPVIHSNDIGGHLPMSI